MDSNYPFGVFSLFLYYVNSLNTGPTENHLILDLLESIDVCGFKCNNFKSLKCHLFSGNQF